MSMTHRPPEAAHLNADRADREWMRHASCRGHDDPEIWFPTNGHEDRSRHYRTAKQICAACPVRLACLRYAIATDARHGVYGGLTGHERTRLTGRRFYG